MPPAGFLKALDQGRGIGVQKKDIGLMALIPQLRQSRGHIIKEAAAAHVDPQGDPLNTAVADNHFRGFAQ